MSHPLLTAPIGRSLFQLSGPTTALMLTLALVTIADVYFVGRLGTEALAGLALVIPFSTLMLSIANGAMGGSVAASLARALGAGHTSDARAIVAHAFALAVAFGSFFTLADLIAAPWLFGLLGGNEAVVGKALSYSHIWFAGAVIIWMRSFLYALLRGSGDAATPGRYGVLTALVYVPLTGVLTLGIAGWPGLGLAGPAVSSLVTSAVNDLALVRALLRSRLAIAPTRADFRLRGDIFRDILHIGGMGLISTLVASVTAMLVTGLVGRFGVVALAGYGIGVQVEFMVTPVAFGIGSGLTTLVGVAAGAGAWPRAMRASWIGGLATFSLTGLIGWIIALLPEPFVHLFTSDGAVILASAAYITHVAPFYCMFGLGLALFLGNQGAGRMTVPVVAGIARMIVATAGGWLLISAGFGLNGVFIAIAASMIVYGGAMAGALLVSPWENKQVAMATVQG